MLVSEILQTLDNIKEKSIYYLTILRLETQKVSRNPAIYIYLISLILWFLIYYQGFFIPAFSNSLSDSLKLYLFFSLFVFIVPTFINIWLSLNVNMEEISMPKEIEKLKVINQDGGHLITIISIFIAALVLFPDKTSFPREFEFFAKSIGLAGLSIMVGILPLYWVSDTALVRSAVFLRAVKTSAFIHALSWLTSAAVFLIDWVLIESKYMNI